MEIVYRFVVYDRHVYDRHTERALCARAIPAHLIPEVKRIAGFKSDHDGLGDYALAAQQAREIGQVIGAAVDPEAFDYAVEPYVGEGKEQE